MNGWYIFQMILFIGAVQGLIMGMMLLVGRYPRKKANRWLGLLLVFFAYRLITEALKSMGLTGVDSWTYYLFLEYHWIYGALIYFYVSALIEPDFRIRRSDGWHFVPLIFEVVISIFIKVQNLFWDGTKDSLSWLGFQGYRLWMHTPLQSLVFSGLILIYVHQSQKKLNQYTANNAKLVQMEDVHWLQTILRVYILFSLIVIATNLIDFLFLNFAFNPVYKFPVYIGMSLITYWLGLKGYNRRDTDYVPEARLSPPPSNLELEKFRPLLESAMVDQKLYKNPKLTLTDLSKAINLKPYQTTQVLNRSLHKSFSDFVNEYRVNEVERLINDPDHQQFTLLSLAYEAGFNSKASFNRIVKRVTGKSPKDLKI